MTWTIRAPTRRRSRERVARNEVAVDPGAYSVSEPAVGYAASFSADCTGTIAIGETKTCTVTNDDIAPKLIVIKHVINDDGGTTPRRTSR